MKKLDKAKTKKVFEVFGVIVTLACFVAGIIAQLHDQNTTEALCWVIVGLLNSAIKVEVK